MGTDPVDDLPRQVERLQHFEDPDALLGVEPLAIDVGAQGHLAIVAERWMAHLVPQTDRLHQRLVQPECLGQRATDLSHLQGMGQPGNERDRLPD